VDAVVGRALTGHVTERMQRHYSHVGNDEKRAALAGSPPRPALLEPHSHRFWRGLWWGPPPLSSASLAARILRAGHGVANPTCRCPQGSEHGETESPVPRRSRGGRKAAVTRKERSEWSGTRGSNPRLSAWESRRTPSSDGYLRVDTGDDLTPGIPFHPVSTRGQWGHRWGPGSGLSVTLRRCEIAFLPPLRRTNNSGSRFPSAIFSTDLFRASPFSLGTNIAGPR